MDDIVVHQTNENTLSYIMMTLLNEDTFYITSHLSGESTGHRWILATKDQ